MGPAGPGVQQQEGPEGAWIQANTDEASSLSLIPIATRDFEQDLKQIRRKFRARQRQQKLDEQADEARRQEEQEKLLAAAPASCEGVSASQTFGVAHSPPASNTVDLEWFPPCKAFAQASSRVM